MPARKITIANGKKRQALTTITHSIARCGLPSQFGASARLMMPSAIMRPVDDAVERIEHPLPGDGGERDRHRPGQYDQRPDDLAPREWPQQQQRAELAEDEAEQLRSEREDEGVAQRFQKDRVLHDLLEIRQADEAPRGIVDRVGADRVIYREQKRHANQQQDIKDRRRDEDGAEHIAPVQDEPKARGRFGDWFSDWAMGENPFQWRLARLPSLSKWRSAPLRTAKGCHSPGRMLSSATCAGGSFAVITWSGSKPSIAP